MPSLRRLGSSYARNAPFSMRKDACARLFRRESQAKRTDGLRPRTRGRLEKTRLRLAERTDWLPAPTRRAASMAQSTRLLLSGDLVAYCGSVGGHLQLHRTPPPVPPGTKTKTAATPRMERLGSCSAWDEDHETDDVMAEVLTRSASAAQREAREPLRSLSNQPEKPQPPASARNERAPSARWQGGPRRDTQPTESSCCASSCEGWRSSSPRRTRGCGRPTGSWTTPIGRGEGSCASLARDETAAASCGCRPAMRSTTSSSRGGEAARLGRAVEWIDPRAARPAGRRRRHL